MGNPWFPVEISHQPIELSSPITGVPSPRLITDRFADGDPRNNELFASGFDVRDMTYRHGGDFLGVCLGPLGDRKMPVETVEQWTTPPENMGISGI